MKKNLFLRLCLMMVVVLSFNSCRQDLLPEQEIYHNTSAFQLTSKRISLNDSEHKAKLLLELEKAEEGFKKLTPNTLGKTVNYGNGVSIDTDDVVYIEYGPYHTYTFKINRENASADAPAENLILSLEPDGTYKELVKTYNLTQNDWQELSLGNGIDLEGKTTTVEFAKGTYYQANAKSSGCSYQSQQVYKACCHGVHGEGNIGEWGNCTCTGSGLPKMYTIEVLVCPPEPGAPTTGWTPTPSSPTAPSGVGGEPLNGGNTSGSETNPTDPNTVEGAQGQLGGAPTLPNLVGGIKPQTPCTKLKELLNPLKTDLKEQIQDEMYPSIDNNPVGEMGIHLKRDANGNIETEIEPLSTDSSSPPQFGGDYYSGGHTHPKNAYPMFTYSDIMVLVKADAGLADHNKGLASRLLFCEDENGVKQTYVIVFESTGNPIQNTWNDPNLASYSLEKKIDELDKKLYEKYNEEYSKPNPNFERFILQYLYGYNIGLYKANSDLTNWSKLSISENSETATVIPTNCN